MPKVKVKCNHCSKEIEWYASWITTETGYLELDDKWYCDECRQKFVSEWAISR